MIHPAVSLLCLAFYASLMSQRETFYLSDLLPLCLLAGLRVRALPEILRRLALINFFLGLIVLTVWLIAQDPQLAARIFVRSNLAVAFALLLFCGHDSTRIVRGMQSLRFPKRFVAISFFCVKFIALLLAEMQKMKTALSLRRFRPGTNRFTYETTARMIGMLIVRTFHRCERLNDAMALRGFRGEIYFVDTHALRLWDGALAALTLLVPVLGIGVML